MIGVHRSNPKVLSNWVAHLCSVCLLDSVSLVEECVMDQILLPLATYSLTTENVKLNPIQQRSK